MNPTRRARTIEGLGTILLLLAAFLVRLSPWKSIFRGGDIFFVDTDDYYHLRRMMTAAANFPGLPGFDYYLGHPSGFSVQWPPFYDWIMGALTWVLGAGAPTLELSQTTAALAPPVLGVIGLCLFYAVARDALGSRGARVSLAFAAILPMPVFYTMLGRPDHHCFEIVWVLAAWACASRLLSSENRHECLIWASGTAASLLLGLLSWVGTFFFALILFIFMMFEMIRHEPSREKSPEPHFWFAAVFLLPAPWLLWAGTGVSFDFDALSLFQPLLMTCCGLWCLFLYIRRDQGWTWGAFAVLAAATSATGLLLRQGVPSLAAYAELAPPMFQSASELQPFFKPHGSWSLDNARAYFGSALWLLPLAAGFFATEKMSPLRRLALFWTLLTGLLAVWQTRYALHLSFPAALLLGYGAVRLYEKIRKLPELAINGGSLWAAGLVLLVSTGLLFSALKNVAGLSLADPESLTDSADLLSACRWIREHTPPTRSLWKDEGRPEYGVYSLHSIGNQVAAIAQRPAVAGNMHVLRRALENSVIFFFMDDSARARAFLRRGAFRYILLGDMIHDGLLAHYARMYGLKGYETASRSDGALEIPAKVWDLVYMRLYVLDGGSAPGRRGQPSVPPLDTFRLVYESEGERHGTSRFKVFEAVEGARLSGRCAAGTRVEGSIQVITSRGRQFRYQNDSLCGRTGRYEMNLPYAGIYDIGRGGAALRRRISAAEEQILSGALLSLDIL